MYAKDVCEMQQACIYDESEGKKNIENLQKRKQIIISLLIFFYHCLWQILMREPGWARYCFYWNFEWNRRAYVFQLFCLFVIVEYFFYYLSCFWLVVVLQISSYSYNLAHWIAYFGVVFDLSLHHSRLYQQVLPLHSLGSYYLHLRHHPQHLVLSHRHCHWEIEMIHQGLNIVDHELKKVV